MSISQDWSLSVRKCLNALYAYNLRSTAMGVFFGLVLFLLKTAFSPVLSNFQWLDHKSVSAWMLMAFGVFSFNLPNYMRRRAELPPDIEIQIEKIRRMKEAGHLSRENEARLWLLLVGAQTQAATSVAETQG